VNQRADTSRASERNPEEVSRDGVIPVVFVSSHATMGGSERFLRILLDHLDKSWIRAVVCLKEGPFADELRARGLPVEVIDTGAGLRDILASARRLRRLSRRSGACVIHANGVKAALVAVLATRRTATRVIWFKHDVSRDGWQARFIASRCARVVAVSSAVAESLYGRTRTKVEVLNLQIPEPVVDSEAARRLVLSQFAPDHPAIAVILVGRLDPFKGHREILSAVPAVLDRVPEVGFLFVGGDDPAHPGYGGELRREAHELGLGDSVRFTGYRQDALALIAGSDVLVIPSVADARGMGKEGFPYVGLEALALGTPVVAYAHGGIPEQLGECGILVPPNDRQALAAAIVRLARDDTAREQLARCGRERFRSRYLLSSLVGDVCERYRAAALGRSQG
jgi:glycosyltransferase involved in cell wall biosynthesis